MIIKLLNLLILLGVNLFRAENYSSESKPYVFSNSSPQPDSILINRGPRKLACSWACGDSTDSCTSDQSSSEHTDSQDFTVGQVLENLGQKFPKEVRDTVSHVPENFPLAVEKVVAFRFGKLLQPFNFLMLLWCEGQFEIDDLPTALQTKLMVQRDLYYFQKAYKWLWKVWQENEFEKKPYLKWLSHLMPPPIESDVQVAYPCDTSKQTLVQTYLIDEPLSCECIGTKCRVSVSPTRNPCLFLDATGLVGQSWTTSYKVQWRMDKLLFQVSGMVPDDAKRLVPNLMPVYLCRLVLCGLLMYFAQALAGFALVHYAIGAGLGVIVAIVLVIASVYKQTRAIPGSQYFTALSGVFFAASGIFWPQSVLQRMVSNWLYLSKSFFDHGMLGYESLGKIYFGGIALVGVWMTWYCKWFSKAPEDGSRNWTNGQALLCRLITATSILFGLICTSDLEMSAVICIILAWYEVFQYYSYRMHMFMNPGQPAYAYGPSGKPLSTKEFKMQTQEYTRKALEDLRGTYQNNPDLIYTVSEKFRGKADAFAHGQPHIEKDEEPVRNWRCALM